MGKNTNIKHGKIFRCIECGKFIAYNEIPDKVTIEYIPETEVTNEETLFRHNRCSNIS